MTKKLKKKELLVATSEPFIIRHERNKKHNEVTVAVLNMALPLRNLGAPLAAEILEKVKQVGVGFPGTNLHFNFNPEAPAFLFTVKGKTECRGNDVPNQEIGNMVATAKAQAKAAKVAARIIAAIVDEMGSISCTLTKAAGMLLDYEKQEYDFVSEEKYRKVLEKRANKE